jgi:hypothetical protein
MTKPNFSIAARDRLIAAAEATLDEATSYYTAVGTRDNSTDANYSYLYFAGKYELEHPDAAPTIILELHNRTYRFGGSDDAAKFIETLAGVE